MSLLRFRLAGLCALALAGQGLATAARAADFDGPYPPRPPEYAEPAYREPPPPPTFRRPHFTVGPDFEPPERCRSFVKRRIDAYGEEVLRRVRVCDEPGGYDEGPRRRPVFYDHPPRPPADIPDREWGGPRW
ncbi:hypothetical protein FV222_17570 [Methylobacterium sp. WL103]|uniref:hypothetical protein n=1 Tax=unclassified Methylobacterium TaxID=2615210 RepID=UPI0011C82CDC|nr:MULTISPECIES: hypothetical protein [unclassified Methylobacterium]TXM71631.1 hypothetical protein FV226_14690 [Methylobacterium sp. WL12]TXM96687.1 hypothetical protein FV222_17570 [Methylobacterium sp. WL103]